MPEEINYKELITLIKGGINYIYIHYPHYGLLRLDKDAFIHDLENYQPIVKITRPPNNTETVIIDTLVIL